MLIAAAASAGVSVTVGHSSCHHKPELLGGWKVTAEEVFLCPDAIQREGESLEVILRHELIHVIQDRLPAPLIPEPLLTLLTREHVPSEQAMLVLLSEDDTHREFECRVLTTLLSSEAVGQWLRSTGAPHPEQAPETAAR
jgi:hypothetical protein